MSQFPGLVGRRLDFGTLVESDGPDIVVERADVLGMPAASLGPRAPPRWERHSRKSSPDPETTPELSADLEKTPESFVKGAW